MESIGGFELVRRLGAGTRAEVFLGRDRASSSTVIARAVGIKIFRPSTPVSDIEREIETLSRVTSDHVLHLLDVASAPDGLPALVVGPVGVRKLSELIVGARSLTPGEVVTATAPIVQAVAELHRAGVRHGAIRLGNIMFDRRGAPVLVGFGRATLGGSSSSIPAADAEQRTCLSTADVAADLADLAVVIRCVCSVSDAETARVFDHLERLPDVVDAEPWIAELYDLLHDLAPGEPVRFDGSGERSQRVRDSHDATSSSSAVAPPLELGERRAALLERRNVGTPAWLTAWGLPDTVARLLISPMPTTVGRIGEAIRRVRRPFWFAGGGVVAMLVASLVLIPQNGSTSAGAIEAANPPDESVGGELTDGGESIETRVSTELPTEPRTLGDDPVAALQALLEARAGCFAERSILCLDAVVHPGSAAWDADSSAITRQEAGGEVAPLLLRAAETSLSDSLGDSAILTSTDVDTGIVITVLVVRGDTGWRIRDLIAP